MYATALLAIFKALVSAAGSVVAEDLTSSYEETAFKIYYSLSQASSTLQKTQSGFLYADTGLASGDVTSQAAKKGSTGFFLSFQETESADQHKLYIKSAKQNLVVIGTAEGADQRLIYKYGTDMDNNYIRWKITENALLQPYMNRPGDDLLVYHCETHFEIHSSQGNTPASNCEEVTLYASDA